MPHLRKRDQVLAVTLGIWVVNVNSQRKEQPKTETDERDIPTAEKTTLGKREGALASQEGGPPSSGKT